MLKMNTRETFNKFSRKFSDTFEENLYYKRVKNILSRETLKNQDYRKLHHNFCKLMFDDVKSGNEVWIQIDEIYSFDDNTDNLEKPNNFVRVSLLNQKMLDYDRNMFDLLSSENEDHELARAVFRPYFLHFLIDIAKIDENSKDFISNAENLRQWFYGVITDDTTQTLDITKGYVMKGLLESSASPVEYDGKYLIIRDTHLPRRKRNKINRAYAVRPNARANSDTDVNNYLNTTFNNTRFSSVRTYNVGNGNCIYLHGRSNMTPKRLLYDIGYNCSGYAPRYPAGTPYSHSVNAIRSMRPDCIILSHWDTDHIMGCTYAPQRLFQCKWIAPICTDASPGAKRLCKYLDYLGNLMLINRNPTTPRTDAFARVTSGASTISFWMGVNCSPRRKRIRGHIVARDRADRGITKVNREGIIIEISNHHNRQTTNSLLLGDVRYSSIPDGINLINGTSIDYFVVPHHGADMDYYELDNSNIASDACAIISASGSSYHPHDNHLTKLMTKGFHTYVTRGVTFYIEFSLLNPNIVHLV